MVVQINPGQTIFVDVTITNNSSDTSGTAFVRCSLLNPTTNEVFDLTETTFGNLDAEVPLAVGETKIALFSMLVPVGTPGLFSTVVAVNDQPNLAGNVLAQITEPNQVEIIEDVVAVPFAVTIVDAVEHL